MIFNTQYETQPGQHWIAVFINGTMQEAYLFDSMPLQPFPQLIRSRLSKLATTIHNTNPDNLVLQDPTSPLCGIYCLAFLEHISKGQTLELCANNQLKNDIDILAHMWPFIAKTFFVE